MMNIRRSNPTNMAKPYHGAPFRIRPKNLDTLVAGGRLLCE